MYRTTDSRTLLRKYTLGPYGVLTLFSARAAAQKILLARLDGQDPSAARQASRRRPAGLRLEEVIAQYRTDYLEPRGVGGETLRILKRIMLTEWRDRQITDISRADIRQCIDSIMQRGAVAMAARAFRVIRAMFNWCVGRGLIETSACVGLVPPPTGRPRDRVLTDDELAVVLGSTMARRSHAVHLTPEMLALLPEREDDQPLVFSSPSGKPFQAFGETKKRHDKASGVSDWVVHDLRRTVASDMAALGIVPHVADKILNHQGGAIRRIAAVYQRHEFMAERTAATELWSRHVTAILRVCNDPAVSAQVTLLIGMLRLVFSFRGPGVAFGYYKSGSSLLWLLRHAECSRSDDGGRIALSASE